MKKLGIIILLTGIAITVFAGVSYVTRETVVEIGSMEMMANEHHTLDWSPYLGFGIMAVGLVIFLVGTKVK